MPERSTSGKPRSRAVAIGGPGGARALAAGRGSVADAMLAVAAERGVPIQKDSDLVEVLSALDPATVGSDAATALTAALLDGLYGLNDRAKPAQRKPRP